MSRLTVPTFGTQNHPAGQITLSARRHVSARASALVGYRVDMLVYGTTVSMVHAGDSDAYVTAN
jgi:hypothetical protein